MANSDVPVTAPQTILARSRPEGDCMVWTGVRDKNGYGSVTIDGRKHRVHRYVWSLANGPIPEGMFICHHCDNPPCWKLEHLFLGTAQDNNDDMIRKGRRVVAGTCGDNARKTHCPHGHEYTPENTYNRPSRPADRSCVTCRRARLDEAIAERGYVPPTEWLRQYLAAHGGTAPAADVLAAAYAEGWGRTTIFRARRKVAHAKRSEFGGPSTWTLAA